MNMLLWRETDLVISTGCITYTVEFTVPGTGLSNYLGIYCDTPPAAGSLSLTTFSISYQSVCLLLDEPVRTLLRDPGAPVITSITDPYPCEAGSPPRLFTEGSGATQHDLYMADGTLVMYGIPSSPAFIAPGDDDPHEFVIRAIKRGMPHRFSSRYRLGRGRACSRHSVAIRGGMRTSATATGIEVSWPAVPGATSYDLKIDGTTIVDDAANPYIYSPETPVRTHSASGRRTGTAREAGRRRSRRRTGPKTGNPCGTGGFRP